MRMEKRERYYHSATFHGKIMRKYERSTDGRTDVKRRRVHIGHESHGALRYAVPEEDKLANGSERVARPVDDHGHPTDDEAGNVAVYKSMP